MPAGSRLPVADLAAQLDVRKRTPVRLLGRTRLGAQPRPLLLVIVDSRTGEHHVRLCEELLDHIRLDLRFRDRGRSRTEAMDGRFDTAVERGRGLTGILRLHRE